MQTSIVETAAGAILLVVIPWRYVWMNYVVRPGDPWMRSSSPTG